MSDTKFAIEYDFSNQDGVVVIDHVKGVVYAKTCEEANKKFNMLVNKSKSYSSTFIKLGKPSFLGDSLIDIFTSYKVFRDGKIVKDLPIPEYVSENMNSIYKQMNNIDDKESLNEKYNVRTLKDVKKLKEGLTIHEHEPEFAEYTPKIYLPTDKQGKCELVIYASLSDFDDPTGDWDVNVEMNDSRGYPAFEIDVTKGLADEIDNLGHIYLTSYSFEEAEEVCDRIREYFIEVDSEDFYDTFVNVLHCDRAGVEKLWNNPADKLKNH